MCREKNIPFVLWRTYCIVFVIYSLVWSDVRIKVRFLKNYFVSRVLEKFKLKIISWKFCPGKCFVWMDESLFWKIIRSYYSVHVLVCCCWRKMEILMHAKYFSETVLGTWRASPLNTGVFTVLVAVFQRWLQVGKQSSYERWCCYCVLDSKNLHFVVQNCSIYPDALSDTQVSGTG